jgi:hypothetical protein
LVTTVLGCQHDTTSTGAVNGDSLVVDFKNCHHCVFQSLQHFFQHPPIQKLVHRQITTNIMSQERKKQKLAKKGTAEGGEASAGKSSTGSIIP